MADRNTPTRLDETRASGGSKEGVVRWVLIIGTLLAIVLLGIIWMTGALSQGDQEGQVTASANMEAQSGDRGAGTDSIVGDGQDSQEGAGDDESRMRDGVQVIENDSPSPSAS